MRLPALPCLLLLSSVACAQTAPTTPATPALFSDPANLRGERVAAKDGNELAIDQGVRGLEQVLRRLNTRASVMNIVAHPDDEDGGMLTFYSRGLGARVADLSLTRGEGGQNAMTGDFEDALGLLRTQELLASDRYTGVDQFFGTEIDFGFSKTKEEAFAKWTRERVLYDAVRAVRLYRPLILTSTWIGVVTDGHGQHQVAGEIAQAVFNAAGDPKVFPEMIAEGILPWQPLKMYARVPHQAITAQGLFDYATSQYTAPKFVNYITGETSTAEPTVDVVVAEGTSDPLLSAAGEAPMTYVQFARLGLGLQRSQVPAGSRLPPAGQFDVAYHRYGSRLARQPLAETNFFAGIDTSIAGLATLAPSASPETVRIPLAAIGQQLQDAQAHLAKAHPEAIAPTLAAVQKALAALMTSVDGSTLPVQEKFDLLHELSVKTVQVNEALTLALGIHFDVIAETAHQPGTHPVFTANEPTPASVPIGARLSILIRKDPGLSADASSKPVAGTGGILVEQGSINLAMPGAREQKSVTRPYFNRPNLQQPFYDLSDPTLRNAPFALPGLVAQDSVVYQGILVKVRSVITAATLLPDGKIFRQPISIVPAVSLTLAPTAAVVPTTKSLLPSSKPGDTAILLAATLRAAPGSPAAKVSLDPGNNWTVDDRVDHAPRPNGEQVTDLHLKALTATVSPQTFVSSALVPGHAPYTEGFRAVGYPGVTLTNYFTPATARIAPVDLRLPTARHIGYLAGTGDGVAAALTSIGFQVEPLSAAEVTADHLKSFDAVVLGVRTYAAHPELHGAPTAALLDYARAGGNVLVQYQTAEFTADDAPYPLTLGSDAEKVIDETDSVRLLPAADTVLKAPNAIAATDFNGWLEERGHGFLRSWDPRYQPLTEVHDPGQAPQQSGLVTVRLGKGRWTYCAFALYRQLPEAVPGAFRLFADLLNP